MNTGKLILKRTKNFNGMAVSMEVFIDGMRMDKMLNGEQKEFELEPGIHKIKVQQNIKCGEQEVVIEPGKTVGYSYSPTPLSIITFLSPLIGLGLLFLFHFSLLYTALILLPGAIVAVYLLTAGRSKYFLFKPLVSGSRQSKLYSQKDQNNRKCYS